MGSSSVDRDAGYCIYGGVTLARIGIFVVNLLIIGLVVVNDVNGEYV